MATALVVPSTVLVAPAWSSPLGGAEHAQRAEFAAGAKRGEPGELGGLGDSVRRVPRKSVPLILAKEAPDDIDPTEWLVSEKYDGVRAWWDGRMLRFRSGMPIAAPASFVASLPPVPLDGELWLGRGRFDELSGIVRRVQPEADSWRDVRYKVFEMPGAGGRFHERARRLAALLRASVTQGVVHAEAVEQVSCPNRDILRAALERVIAQGGEGLMLHRADAPEVHGRSPLLLKLKPLHDDEAVVIGHQPGTGRLAGRLGALRVRDDAGRVFEVGTGLSDAQRAEPPALGTRITFTHRGRTPSGLPRFAALLRERPI
jgi:DNA ligase-1